MTSINIERKTKERLLDIAEVTNKPIDEVVNKALDAGGFLSESVENWLTSMKLHQYEPIESVLSRMKDRQTNPIDEVVKNMYTAYASDDGSLFGISAEQADAVKHIVEAVLKMDRGAV